MNSRKNMAVIDPLKDGLRSVGRAKQLLNGGHKKSQYLQPIYTNSRNISQKKTDLENTSRNGS